MIWTPLRGGFGGATFLLNGGQLQRTTYADLTASLDAALTGGGS
ncbi:hypothetical protein [Pseudonocardia sp. D17]